MLLQQLLELALVGHATAKAVDLSRLFSRDNGFKVDRYAALGDSFAAGPGAGKQYDESSFCRRHEGSWNRRVAADEKVRGDREHIDNFSFIACTGALTKHLIKEPQTERIGTTDGPNPQPPQVGRIENYDPQLTTLSIGGNDVGFSFLLDNCVYGFHNPGCVGCGPAFGDFDDCTNSCEAAINIVRDKIDGTNGNFPDDFSATIKAIFDKAPKTHLFITGYPRFFNEKTDDCDKRSFQFGCNDNRVLPLIKDRRQKMNALTMRLDEKIKDIISKYSPPEGASITYVDTDPYFEGHRFCEEGVQEPSYRNKNIWFFPCEFFTNGAEMNFTVTDKTPSGDCDAILDGGGGNGNYHTCLIANAVNNGAHIDLNSLPNNVAPEEGDDEPNADAYPLWIVRTFHPTNQGHEAYQKAFFAEYDKMQDGGAEADILPEVKCNGLDNKYVTRGTLSKVIAEEHCPKLSGATGSIGSAPYLQRTPERVDISTTAWNENGVPTPDQCIENFKKIIDSCDNDAEKNPMQWSAGGSVEIDNWTYTITPTVSRAPAPKKPSAWCQLRGCTGNGWCDVKLWGAAWLETGFGVELRDALRGVAFIQSKDRIEGIDDVKWGENFLYENMDGHDWTVEFTIDWMILSDNWGTHDGPKLIVDTMKKVANDQDSNFLQVDACAKV